MCAKAVVSATNYFEFFQLYLLKFNRKNEISISLAISIWKLNRKIVFCYFSLRHTMICFLNEITFCCFDHECIHVLITNTMKVFMIHKLGYSVLKKDNSFSDRTCLNNPVAINNTCCWILRNLLFSFYRFTFYFPCV